jgi:NAD(P)H dehydrogenase (quinone)
LIVIHSVWWGGPPAILKGWIDRVVRRGVAYDVVPKVDASRMGHVGRLRVQAAVVFNTADTPDHLEDTLFHDSVGVLWKSYIAAMCGIPVLERHSFSVMGTSTAEMRSEWLGTVEAVVARLFPARAPSP